MIRQLSLMVFNQNGNAGFPFVSCVRQVHIQIVLISHHCT